LEDGGVTRFLDLDADKKNPDWQIVFQGGVNAGDASAILEESPFESAYGLWLTKTKRKPRPKQTAAMLSGQNTEPLIFEWYSRIKNLKGESQVWAVMDDPEWIRGLGDFWCAASRHGAEFKAPTRDDSADHRLAKEGQVPQHYWLQCIHLMEVYDALTWDFVSWRSPEDVAVIPVERDTDYWLTVMLPAYQEFKRRVDDDEWPRPEGTVMEESPEWAEAARLVIEGKSMSGAGEQYKRRGEAMLRRMATAKTTIGSGIKATWNAYRARIEAAISITGDTPEDMQKNLRNVMSALAPLQGRPGIGKITPREYPPNMILRISESDNSGSKGG